MKVLVSACLLGRNCKYNGGSNENRRVKEFLRDKEVVEICPELLAGLGVPRTPIEIVGGILMDKEGNCPDKPLRDAVAGILKRLEGEKIDLVILQSRSPTCGVNQVYDGSFSGRLIPGQGAFARALMDAGYTVTDAEDL